PMRVEQVLINLLTNAIKFSPDDQPITICVESTPTAQLQISVADRGAGVAPEHRAHIFDQFYQAHAPGTFGGLGLGLAIAQSIVNLHGGAINAEFPAAGGTHMIVTLPLDGPHAPSAAPGGDG
ncbi:MAG TPA: ATP-binding protein, partial [Roseiflexaceae bacterium]|nr:ATP-binding protein [Roseiflexaceae bacterium]